jgi:tetratricopeptide (TPR) repeat protein
MGVTRFNPDIMSPEMLQVNNQYNLGRKAAAQGNLEEAIKIYQSLLAAYPDFVAARVNLASALALGGNPSKALQHLNYAHSIAPNDPDVHLIAGVVYECLGNKELEIEQYHEALRDQPQSIAALNSLGAAYRESGQLQQSKATLQEAIEIIKDQARIFRASGGPHPQELKTWSNLALTYEEAEDWHNALDCWQRCALVDPASTWVHQMLQQAEDRARQSARPASVPPTILSGEFLSDDKSAEAAKLYNIGNQLGRQGHFAEAIQYFEAALRANPHDPSIHNNMGTAYKKLGMLREAEVSYRKALELDPTYRRAHIRIACVMVLQRHRADAEQELMRYLLCGGTLREAEQWLVKIKEAKEVRRLLKRAQKRVGR